MPKTKIADATFDLKSKPARPLDPSNLSNDQATLRALVGQLNENPKGVDPNAAVDTTKYSGPVGVGNKTLALDTIPDESALHAATPESPPPPSPVQQPQASAPIVRARRLVLTGRDIATVTGLLGAIPFTLNDRALTLAQSYFPGLRADAPGFQQFIETVFAWGAAEFSDKYPVTIERALFVRQARENIAGYGTDAGFWTDDVVKAIKTMNSNDFIVVSGVPDSIALRYFQAMGFQHWHITGPAGQVVDSFSAQLDQEVIKAISAQRQGPKLRSIWNSEPAPSPRLWSLADFIGSYK